jgi:TP901 family phage tail tape measure protein
MAVGSGLFSAGLASAGGMGTRVGAAFVEIFADTSGLQRGFASAETLATSFGARMQSSGAIIGRVGSSITRNLSLPLAALGGVSVKMASDFETAMTRTSALAGVAEQDIGEFRKEVLRLSEETAQAPKDLADSLFFVASAGLKDAQVLPVLEATAKGAAAQLGSAADLGQLLTSVLVAYQHEAPSAAQAMDVLVAAVREGKAEPADLAAAMGTVVPVAAEMGVSFDELAGAIAAATNVGIESARAATGLRYMMIQLQNPTEAAKKELENYGLTVGQVQGWIQDDLITGLRKLGDTFDLNTVKGKEAFFTTIGGVRSGQVALALMGKSAERTQAIMDETAKAAGGTADEFEDAFQRMTETPGFRFQKAWNDLKLAAIDAGAILLPIAQDLVETIADLASAFTDLPKATQHAIIGFGLFVIAAGPVLSIFGRLLSIGGSVIRMFETLGSGAAAASAAAGKGVGAAGAATGVSRVAGIATGLGEAGLIAGAAVGIGATANRLVDVWGTTNQELADQTGLTVDAVKMLDDQVRTTAVAFNLFADRGDKVREAGTILTGVVQDLTKAGWGEQAAWDAVNQVLEASSQDIGGITGSLDTLDQNVRARLGLLTGEAAKTLAERRFGAVVEASKMAPFGEDFIEGFRRSFDPESVKEFRSMLVSLEESGIDTATVLAGPLQDALESNKLTYDDIVRLFGEFKGAIPFAELDSWHSEMLLGAEGLTEFKQGIADTLALGKQTGAFDPSMLRQFNTALTDAFTGEDTLSHAGDVLSNEIAPQVISSISDMTGSLTDHQLAALAAAAADEDWLNVLELIDKFQGKQKRRERERDAALSPWQDPKFRRDAAEFMELSQEFGRAWAEMLAPGKGKQPAVIMQAVQDVDELGGSLKDLKKQERVDLKVALSKGDVEGALTIIWRLMRRLNRQKANPKVEVEAEDAKDDLQDVEHSMNTVDNMNATPSVTVQSNTAVLDGIISRLNSIDGRSVEATILTRQITERTGFRPITPQLGGWVPGHGRGDIIPALLEPGEFVVRRRSAQQLGSMLENINRNGALAFHRPSGRRGGSTPIMAAARAGRAGGDGGGSKVLNVNVQGRMEYTPEDLRRNMEGWWRRRDW